MESNPVDPLADIADYYSGKLAEHGPSPRGVDWNGAESQQLRFEQLRRVLQEPADFSLHDLGCGYGAFCDFLETHCRNFQYHGHDISPAMIEAAKRRRGSKTYATFSVGGRPGNPADYAVASGIFNVRLRRTDEWCRRYVAATLETLHHSSRRGFAFNCLTSYSDPERMRDYLYYADPGALFDLCKRRYSTQVALLHDYGLYEFTIIVRK